MAQQAVKGPGGRMHGPAPKVANPGKVLARLFGVLLKSYLPHCLLVMVCILITVLAQVQGTLFMQKLIDDYITPMLASGSRDFTPLAQALLRVGSIYAIGVVAAYTYNRVMVNVTQGTLRNLRTGLFRHMETLPIKYFDTHAHGDIMSVYTNDTDTLRQMISQSMPQMFSSVITIVSVLVSMIRLNIPLTVLALVMVGIVFTASRKLASISGRYFVAQQSSLGAVNGYIEEMMEGQKVVKVFCYEEENLEKFRKLNEELRQSAEKANSFANILMPVCGNLGNLSYVLCALLGALFAINGYAGVTLGMLVTFLTLNRSLNMPIAQISQQLNSVVMALAGAQRIFAVLDEKPEVDEGYVDFGQRQGERRRQPDRMRGAHQCVGLEASPPDDGTITYTRVLGDVVFDDVDFRLCGRKDRAAQHQAVRHAGSEDRLCRLHRRRQDHHHQPDQPVLRYPGRQDPLRRHQHQ